MSHASDNKPSLDDPFASSPLDILQQLLAAASAGAQGKPHCDGTNLSATLRGSWSEYALHAHWEDEREVLHLLCGISGAVPADRTTAIYELLSRANENMWLGNFIYTQESGRVQFRCSLLLRDDVSPISKIDEVLHLAVEECDHFYPILLQVAWAGGEPRQVLLRNEATAVGTA